MRYSTPLFGLIGAAAGLAVATTGYQLASAPPAPVAGPSEPMAAVGRPLPAAPAEVRTRFAPCPPHARLAHGVCVTDEWRTTVVYAAAPALPAPAPVAVPQRGARPAAPVRVARDGREHDRADDGEDHEVEDDHADAPEVED